MRKIRSRKEGLSRSDEGKIGLPLDEAVGYFARHAEHKVLINKTKE